MCDQEDAEVTIRWKYGQSCNFFKIHIFFNFTDFLDIDLKLIPTRDHNARNSSSNFHKPSITADTLAGQIKYTNEDDPYKFDDKKDKSCIEHVSVVDYAKDKDGQVLQNQQETTRGFSDSGEPTYSRRVGMQWLRVRKQFSFTNNNDSSENSEECSSSASIFPKCCSIMWNKRHTYTHEMMLVFLYTNTHRRHRGILCLNHKCGVNATL